jgi:putative photosynthetic complex assembly protein
MSEITDRPFPRGALAGAAVMVGASLALAVIVRLSGTDISSPLPPATLAARDLQFVDGSAGSVTIYDASDHQQVAVLAPGTNGFMRAMMRNFARERRSDGIGSEVPFHLQASPDGRLVLEDPATGRHVDLEAFGQTNAAAFADLLGHPRPGDRK